MRTSQIDSPTLPKIIGWMAGDAAIRGTDVIDSNGLGISRYGEWHNAKYGNVSVRRFAKPRVARAPRGMVCAAAVTPGRANDSPYLGTMLARMPRGSGGIPADPQYGRVENCRAARE